MANLKVRVASVVQHEEAVKVDLSFETNETFHKVDGGLTLYLEDHDVATRFEEANKADESIVAVFMSEKQYDNYVAAMSDEAALDAGVTVNTDGSIEYNGKRYLPESFLKSLRDLTEDDKAIKPEMKKATPSPANNEAGSIIGDSEFRVGSHLEELSNTKDRGLVSGPGPDTQME